MDKIILFIICIGSICSILFVVSKTSNKSFNPLNAVRDIFSSLPDPNNNKEISQILTSEIKFYKSGKMKSNTIRYHLFLLCASQLTAFHQFYQELSNQQIINYFKAVQVFTVDEVSTIVQELANKAGNNNDADSLLQQVLQVILCPYKKSKKDDELYLSPCCCKELYDIVIKEKYKTKWGIYTPGHLFDFNSSQIQQMRQFQETHSSLPRIQRSADKCLVIYGNNLNKIYEQPFDSYEKQIIFEKVPPKPTMNWEKNIHQAATKGNVKSLQYNIYLLPFLLDLQDGSGNTPAHLASKNGDDKSIIALKNMNANFEIYNDNGNLPIHIVKSHNALEALLSAGCKKNVLNKYGKTVIEVQSNPFNKDVIEGLINHGVNILRPNQKGLYWMQYVIRNNYFTAKKNNYAEFLKFVRKIISKSKYDFYTSNEYLQEILKENVYESEEKDANILRDAVLDRNVNKIKTYIAMGARPDTKIGSGLTNLMIASERGDTELVKIFANNYCDPNKENNRGENSFWIAAVNKYYDVATLLLKNYKANPNILSNSGQTLLHLSYKNQNTELFNYLLNAGVSPNTQNTEQQSVQYIAYLKRDDKIAEMIQDKYNGNINSNGKQGNTLGHLCIKNNDIQRLEYLIGRGLNIENKNNLGYSLFMYAIVNSDNLDLCQKLLNKGANINTQDYDGETPFYYICKSVIFDKKKFDFLLQNKCNINIQDNNRDFPVSQLIKKERNEEALTILEKKARITDPQSPTEPICVAIINKNRFWINKLISFGANGMNNNYPVVERLIQLEFFDFDILKKLEPVNAAVGAPIQAAIKRRLYSVAHYLWDNANDNSKVIISKSLDEEHRIPISAAILSSDEYLVNQLIDSRYDLSTPDNIRRTPFMYACIYNNQNWITRILPYLTLENLNIVDLQQNSALTFVANNGLVKIADSLFIKGVNVHGINFDGIGIIKRYISLLDRYSQITNRALNNRDNSKNYINEVQNKIDNSQRNIDRISNSIYTYKRRRDEEEMNGGNPYQYNNQIRSLENDLSREKNIRDQWKKEKSKADRTYQAWSKNYEEIKAATREKILYNIDYLDHISKYINTHSDL